MKLKFLGTGGGRFVTGLQRRRTAGIILESDETQIHIDPGPGALVYSHREVDSEKTEAVLISHAHPDHSNDAEPMIEMMTQAYSKPGAVFANETCFEGSPDIEKRISDYHQGLCVKKEVLEPGNRILFKGLEIKTQFMKHGDPNTAGFRISSGEKTIGFWTDSEYDKSLVDFYSDCDTLVVYCTRPRGKQIKGHTAIDDVPKITEKLDLSTVIITHFGYALLDSDLEEQQEWLSENTDCKVVFAEDNMEFPGNRSLGDF
ncbi:MAG: MBL fold metallo-hydrolase [Candidatus Nanohaloarchaea archaeon]